jgi:hypothetical protein
MTTLPPGHLALFRPPHVNAAPKKTKPRLAEVLWKSWSGKRDSNSRPRPWQGRALPTELFPHRRPRILGIGRSMSTLDDDFLARGGQPVCRHVIAANTLREEFAARPAAMRGTVALPRPSQRHITAHTSGYAGRTAQRRANPRDRAGPARRRVRRPGPTISSARRPRRADIRRCGKDAAPGSHAGAAARRARPSARWS